MRGRRVARWVGLGVGVVAAVILVAVLIVTQTDWGRERVRQVALDRIGAMIDGEIEIGRVEGNLLSRIRLIDVAIRDNAGRPFLVADTLETEFGLGALLRQRLELADLRVVDAHIVLDKPPGEEWNYVRIFDTDPEETGPGRRGWGDWVALEDVTLVDTRVTVRTEWRPPDDLTPEERRAAIRNALAGDDREHVVAVPGGYQNVMEFRDLDAELPRVLVAHPDTAGMAFEVATLSGLVRPFSTPPARVHDFAGEFRVVHDSLFMSGVRAELPNSLLAGGGTYALHSGELLLIAHGNPVAFADLRWIYPPLPEEGGGSATMRLELGSVTERIVLMDMDAAVGNATATGRLDVTTGDTVRFGPTDLRFARVPTPLLERFFDVDMPRPGELSGRLALLGRPRALRVDADVRFDDAAGPTSRVIAEGGLSVEPDLGFQELRLRFDPLQAELARSIIPELPLRGTIEGTALLTGSPASVDLEADLALRDPRHGLSRVRLAGGLDTREALRLRDMEVRMDPLRLDLLRDEIPELPAGATATGRVLLDGVLARAIRVDGDIVLDDPATGVSEIGATGELAFEEEVRFRDLHLRFSPLQSDLARLVIPELPIRGTMEGTATITGSTASLDLEADLALNDPRHGVSHVVAAGGLDIRGDLRLRDMVFDLDPLRLDLLRGDIPELPAGATATGRVALDGFPSGALRVDGDIILDDPVTGRSEIAANGGLDLDGPPDFEELRVRVSPLQADLLRPWVPHLPRGGSFVGALSLDGAPSGFLHVDGELTHRHARLGVSQVEVNGGLDLTGAIEFRALDLRLEPLHMALVHAFAPDIPLGGTLRGTARLDGSPGSVIAVTGNIVHEEAGERSHVIGEADIATGPGGWAAVDVRLEPLSLDVAGRFLPGAGLQGTVTGRLEASGNMDDLRLDADLRTGEGGTIAAEGTLDLSGAEPVYDLDMRVADFDLAAVTWRAPAETDLTGTVSAQGRGLDPATMRATIAADLTDSGINDVGADLVRLRLALESGLARVDSSMIRLDGAEALLDGSFGLVAGRDGVLAYEVTVDSLHAFAPWLPGADSGVARVRRPWSDLPPAGVQIAESMPDRPDGAPRPDPPLAPLSVLSAEPRPTDGPLSRHYVAPDGARVTETITLVEGVIERPDPEPPRVPLQVIASETVEADGADSVMVAEAAADAVADTLPSDVPPTWPLEVPTDSLAGSLNAAGTARGNVTRFDLDGRAVVDNLLYQGAYIGEGEAEYALADVGTATPDIRLDAELYEVRTAAVAFDSLSARGRYHGLRGEGTGEAVVVAYGTGDTEYRADAEFTFSPELSEVRIANLLLRADTVTWELARPGAVSWRNDAVQLADVELVSDAGGRLRLDGRLPVDGSGDLDVVVEDLEIAQLVGLLQLQEEATGRVDLEANLQGTLASPRITGTARLEEGTLDGGAVPDVRATFSYEGQELVADAILSHEGRQLATAEGRVPIDLSLMPSFSPRLLPGGLSVDVQADSLPIEAIPSLSRHLEGAEGRVGGDLAVRGTVADPIITGDFDVDLGAVTLLPLGIRLEDVAGSLTLDGNVVRVDSLVARSGGPIRVTGEIGVDDLTEPTFGLDVETRETLVIDTEDIALRVDADLTVGGSLAALEIGGEVRTRSGVVRIPELTELGETEVVSLHEPATSERIERAFLEDLRLTDPMRPLLDRLRLDVALYIDRDVWLRSTEMNVEIYTAPEVGPLLIRTEGPEMGLALEGTLRTDRGEYEFMTRRFALTRGSATFVADPDINPVLQIAAEHEVRLPGREAFDLRVLIGGTLRELEITLESNSQPPIAQTDLLAYLAFGRNASSLLYRQGSPLSSQGGDAGELVGNVAGLATQQLGTIALDAVLGDIEAEVMEDLPVDLFRITPADLPPDVFSGSYGDVIQSTELEAGRYLTSRLFVAGQLTTSISRPGIRVEYVTPFGVRWLTTWRSQWMAAEPTLTGIVPRRAGVLGSFLVREWRF